MDTIIEINIIHNDTVPFVITVLPEKFRNPSLDNLISYSHDWVLIHSCLRHH